MEYKKVEHGIKSYRVPYLFLDNPHLKELRTINLKLRVKRYLENLGTEQREKDEWMVQVQVNNTDYKIQQLPRCLSDGKE